MTAAKGKKPASPDAAPLGQRMWRVLAFLGVSTVLSGSLHYVLDDATHEWLVGPIYNAEAFRLQNALYQKHFGAVSLHILPGCAWMLLCLAQVVPSLRRRSLAAHRWLGRVAFALALASMAGLYLITPIAFSQAEVVAATFYGLYFTYATLRAWYCAYHHRVPEHRAWALRAVAIGFGVGTIRLIYAPYGLLGFDEGHSLQSLRERFGAIFWSALTINAAAVEWYLATSAAPAAKKAA